MDAIAERLPSLPSVLSAAAGSPSVHSRRATAQVARLPRAAAEADAVGPVLERLLGDADLTVVSDACRGLALLGGASLGAVMADALERNAVTDPAARLHLFRNLRHSKLDAATKQRVAQLGARGELNR